MKKSNGPRGIARWGMVLCLGLLQPTAGAGDGTLRWAFPVGGWLYFCPAIDEAGVVYISAPDKNVHALDGETGAVRWSCPTAAGLSTTPVLGADGTVYVGLADTNIVALNGATGAVRWLSPSGKRMVALALSDTGTLFASDGAGRLLASDAADGSARWEVDLPTTLASSSLAVDAAGDLYVSAGGRLFRVSGATGDVLGDHPTDGLSASGFQPVLGPDGTVYCGSRHQGLHALDAGSGALRWRAGLARNREDPSVIGPDGSVYASVGQLHALQAATGRTQWTFRAEGVSRLQGSAALAADGTLYVGASDGNLHAIDSRNGAEKWRFSRPGSSYGPPTIGPDGTVYVGCQDGNLYALEGSAPLAESPWPKWQQNSGNTGQSRWMEGATGIIGQSGDQRAAEGSTVRFWINVKGAPPFDYQWYFEDEPIPGATSSFLVLPDIGFADAGRYRAVAANGLGSATSEPMTLAVPGHSLAVQWYPSLGTVTGMPPDAMVSPGTEVVLEAQGAAGHPFLGWEGDIESAENPLTVKATSHLRIRARFAVEPGTLLWTFDAGSKIRGSPAIDCHGTVYFGIDATLVAVRGDSGTLKWRTGHVSAPLQIPTPVVGAHQLVYASDLSSVVALERLVGQYVWHAGASTPTPQVQKPVSIAGDGTVYQADGQGRLVALNGQTGGVRWESAVGNPSPAAVEGGQRLFVVSDAGQALALDPHNGNTLWNTVMPARSWHPPVADGAGKVFAIKNTGTPCCLLALDAVTGETLWESRLTGSVLASPSIGFEGRIHVQTTSGLTALDGSDGKQLWEVPEAKTSDSSPACAADGTVYVGSTDGKLYAVNGRTGAVIWTCQTGAAIHTSPNLGPDGTVYIGSDDGKLYAIAGSAPLADTPWPKYQADQQNTGRVNRPSPIQVHLSGAGFREDSLFVFEILGPPASTGLWERSEDLRAWTESGTVTLDETGRGTVVDASAPSAAFRFYRVRLRP